MKPPVSIIDVISKKGIDPTKPHIGLVVDNNDPEQLYRVKIRIPLVHDGIKDEDLKWAIPEDNMHGRGLKGGGLGRSVSLLGIPKKGHYVSVYFRHSGDPNLPSYSHRVPVTGKTVPEEFETNYPNRYGQVYPSGFMWIHDETTGETVMCMPGDNHLTVFGDLNQTVIGNHQIHVAKSKSAVPSYLTDTFSSIFGNLGMNQKKRVPFKGLGDSSSGNLHLEVEGDFTAKVGGKVEWQVASNWKTQVGGNYDLTASGRVTVNGTRIDLN